MFSEVSCIEAKNVVRGEQLTFDTSCLYITVEPRYLRVRVLSRENGAIAQVLFFVWRRRFISCLGTGSSPTTKHP
jgi:hypothetical protein